VTDIMSAAGLWKLPAIATFIFLGVFAWVMWRALRPSARQELDQASRVVLDGERAPSDITGVSGKERAGRATGSNGGEA
jgi:cbb3-type cytochrome oxidase subunit 3